MTVPRVSDGAHSPVIGVDRPGALPGGKRGKAPGAEVARLYGLGLTMTEIAGLYRVSAWTIASRLDQAGVPRRRPKDLGGVSPVQRAVRRYRRQPHRLEELAADLGMCAQLIADRAAQPERRRPGRPRDRTDVPAAEVAGLYPAGWTVAQIAARYHTASSTVLHRLDAAGVARRAKSTPVPFPVVRWPRRPAGYSGRGPASRSWPATTRSGSMPCAANYAPWASSHHHRPVPGCCAMSLPPSSPACTPPG